MFETSLAMVVKTDYRLADLGPTVVLSIAVVGGP